jgi:N-acetylglucosaminyldiphosphoundecaprenol N-acetyl-beta-D-mannosaminyltransferase
MMRSISSHAVIANGVAAVTSTLGSERRYANVLGVAVDALDLESALGTIGDRLRNGPKGYVCAVCVHGVLEALHCAAVADALGHAALAVPDGTPMVWVGKAQGHCGMDHVTGPTVMREVLRRAEFAEYSHFFYGGKPGVADELAAKLRRELLEVRIAGTYTPPFRDLRADEEDAVVAMVNRLRPDIVWVGISTPRQDMWMRKMLPRLNTRLMFGVGAAFDFLSGHIQDCPLWMKRSGLNWLHRLAQDPKRLWRRNVQSTEFLWRIALQLSGLRHYSLQKDGYEIVPNPGGVRRSAS